MPSSEISHCTLPMTNLSGDPDNLNILLNSQNGSVSEQTIYRALVVHIPLAKKLDEEKKHLI